MKARIVKRTYPNGGIMYVIQTKCLWWWEDPGDRFGPRYAFNALEEAQANLCYFDGTKVKDEVVTAKPVDDLVKFLKFIEDGGYYKFSNKWIKKYPAGISGGETISEEILIQRFKNTL